MDGGKQVLAEEGVASEALEWKFREPREWKEERQAEAAKVGSADEGYGWAALAIVNSLCFSHSLGRVSNVISLVRILSSGHRPVVRANGSLQCAATALIADEKN